MMATAYGSRLPCICIRKLIIILNGMLKKGKRLSC